MKPTPTHPYQLPALPFAQDALAPVISAATVGCHRCKHHQGYVDTLNQLVAGTRFTDMTLEQIIRATAAQTEAGSARIFNNAVQLWNHNFYWRSLRPRGGGEPPALIKPLILASFDSLDACKAAFVAAAAGARFGSGWIWLVLQGGKLAVIDSANGDVPSMPGRRLLLAIDVWEHAYHLDYQERRAEHVEAVFDRLIDWGFAADNLC